MSEVIDVVQILNPFIMGEMYIVTFIYPWNTDELGQTRYKVSKHLDRIGIKSVGCHGGRKSKEAGEKPSEQGQQWQAQPIYSVSTVSNWRNIARSTLITPPPLLQNANPLQPITL